MQTVTQSGVATVINPGEFAAYVFTAVVGVSALTMVGALARRIGGGRGRGHGTIGLRGGEADTDPGQATRQIAAEVDGLRDEVTELRRELDEAQNRLDFTERLLAQARERGLLAPPKER